MFNGNQIQLFLSEYMLQKILKEIICIGRNKSEKLNFMKRKTILTKENYIKKNIPKSKKFYFRIINLSLLSVQTL